METSLIYPLLRNFNQKLIAHAINCIKSFFSKNQLSINKKFKIIVFAELIVLKIAIKWPTKYQDG